MSAFSAGSRNEAYGSVTRVLIGSSTSTLESVQRASPATTWRTTSSLQKQEYLTLLPRRQRGDGQRQPIIARWPPGSENRPTATRKDFAATMNEIQTWKQQRPPPRPRSEVVDERQLAGLRSSSIIQHVGVGRQQINTVLHSR